MDIAEFISARLDEDEALIRRNSDGQGLADGFPDYRTYDGPDQVAADEYIDHFGPGRMLREVAARRAIVARHAPVRSEGRLMCSTCLGSCTYWACPDLRDVAAIYSDHPDYRPDWAPTTAGHSSHSATP